MLARHYALAVSAQGAQAFLGLVSLFALVRVLPVADFGTFTVLTSGLLVASVAIAAGPQAAALVLSAQDVRSRPELHGTTLVLALGSLALVPLAIVLGPLVELLVPALHPHLIVLTALRLGPVVYAGLAGVVLSGSGRVPRMLGLNLVGAATSLAGPVGALVMRPALDGALLGALAGSWVWSVIALVATRQAVGLRLPRSRRLWSSVAGLALPTHIGTLAYWVMLRADAFLVYALLGPVAAAQYGLALSLSERVSYLTTPLYAVTAWRLSGRNVADALRTLLQVARLEFAIAALAAVAALGLAGPVVDIFAGPGFSGAVVPLMILVVGAALLPAWSSVGLFLISQAGGAWPTTGLQVIVAAAAIGGYLLVARPLGPTGTAIVSTLAYGALTIAGFGMVRRRFAYRAGDLVPRPREVIAGLRSIVAAIRRAPTP